MSLSVKSSIRINLEDKKCVAEWLCASLFNINHCAVAHPICYRVGCFTAGILINSASGLWTIGKRKLISFLSGYL